jgi:hypothetical protein
LGALTFKSKIHCLQHLSYFKISLVLGKECKKYDEGEWLSTTTNTRNNITALINHNSHVNIIDVIGLVNKLIELGDY